MNYGNAKIAAGGTLVATGMDLAGQIRIAIAVAVATTILATVLRIIWRHNKQLGSK